MHRVVWFEHIVLAIGDVVKDNPVFVIPFYPRSENGQYSYRA